MGWLKPDHHRLPIDYSDGIFLLTLPFNSLDSIMNFLSPSGPITTFLSDIYNMYTVTYKYMKNIVFYTHGS